MIATPVKRASDRHGANAAGYPTVFRRYLFHAHAEPVLQLIQGGEPPMLEGAFPKFTKDLERNYVVQAELVGRVGK